MRTDRTFVCTGCRVRTWPVRSCPSCGEARSLGDLEQRPLAELEARRRDAQGSSLLRALLGLGGVGSGVAAIVSFDAGHVGVAEVATIAALGGLIGAALAKRHQPAPVPGPYRLLPSPVARSSMPRETRRGRVRAQRTILSPLTRTPCVAWRLIGTTATMPLDDGQAVPFTLLAGEKEVGVDATIATLDLAPPDAKTTPLTADPDLARWLAARGIDPSAPLEVQEATLVPGDEVEVAGALGFEARADGYRGHSRREVLADRPGSPLVIRAPAPASGGGHVTIA